VSEMGGVVSEMGGVVSEMGGAVYGMGGVVSEIGGVVSEIGGVVSEMRGAVEQPPLLPSPLLPSLPFSAFISSPLELTIAHISDTPRISSESRSRGRPAQRLNRSGEASALKS
jgi:hypothetical protein